MLKTHFELPPVPIAPLSVWQILKLGLNAYRGTFLYCMQLFWLPCLIPVLCTLPTYNVGESTLQVQEVPKAIVIVAIFFLGLLNYAWLVSFRGISLQRLLFSADENCIPSLAFANRLGWKSALARIVTVAAQILSVFGFGFAGISAYGFFFDGDAASGWEIAFIPIAILLFAASYITWFSLEFLFSTFGYVLVTEETSWQSSLRRSFELVKSSFWRGTHFLLLLQMGYLSAYLLVSPTFIVNVPYLLKDAEAPISKTLPFFLFDQSMSFGMDLLLLPFLIICAAYFANDVRLRLELRRANTNSK